MKRSKQPIALLSLATDPAFGQHSIDKGDAGKVNTGKVTYSIQSLAEALTKLGWQVDIFTRKTSPDQPQVAQLSPDCRTVYLEAGPTRAIASNQLLEYLPQAVKAFQAFATKEGTNYPLIHSCDWISGRMGLRLKDLSTIQLIHSHAEQLQDDPLSCPILQTVADPKGEVQHQWHSELSDIQLMTEWDLWQRADQVIVTRAANDAATQRLSYTEAKAKLGFNPIERVVLYVGSAHAQSGLETLIQALALCRDRFNQDANRYTLSNQLRLVLISDGNQQERQILQQIENQLNALQLSQQTRLVDTVSPECLSLYYAAADVCVIPSRYELFGSAALEALMYGTPVVASRVGGLPFVVASQETGLLVPPQDAAAFAEAIARVLSNEVWVRRLKRHAAGQIDVSLSSIQVAAQFSDLYRRLLAYSISHTELWDIQKPFILQVPNAARSTHSVSSIKPLEKELIHIS